MRRFLWLFLLASLILLVDVFTKAWIAALPLFAPIPIFSDWHGIDFSLVHVRNSGAAWGLFASYQQALLYVRIFLLGALITYIVFTAKKLSMQIPLTMIAAGALGNIVDFFIYGQVVDLFSFKFWGYSYPVFNVADSAIFCGIAWLLLLSLFRKVAAK